MNTRVLAHARAFVERKTFWTISFWKSRSDRKREDTTAGKKLKSLFLHEKFLKPTEAFVDVDQM